MEYNVLVEYVLPDAVCLDVGLEPGTIIIPGETLNDGDLEPDIMAGLWSSGIIEPADMEAEALRLADAPDDDATPDDDE